MALARFGRRDVRPGRGASIGLALGLGGLVLYLLWAPKPWQVEGGPAFFAASRHRPLDSNVSIGLWWAAAVNAALLVLLLASRRLWARPLEVPRPPARRDARRAGVALAVLAAMVLGIGLRLPLATKSLWWDEGWTVRQVVVGMYLGPESDPDAWRWRAGSLRRALWYAKKPTNHALYSVGAWSTLGIWRAVHPGPPERFSEWAYRLPALLASAASIAGVALLAGLLGSPRVAPLAAFALALHPWAIRYGAEGRAYSFVVSRGWLPMSLRRSSRPSLQPRLKGPGWVCRSVGS